MDEDVVVVADGKYTFRSSVGKLSCDRYDQKDWMIFQEGSNAIRALMYRCQELEKEVAETCAACL